MASTTITMPQLGETVTEGTVAQWLKRVGDAVEKYEPFVEISTDKVNAEVPSPVGGVLTQIIVEAGGTVPTGAPIAVIEEISAVPAAVPVTESGATNGSRAVVPSSYGASGGAAPENGAARNGHGAIPSGAMPEAARRMSPAVRRLAREHRIDVAALHGTGNDGRVTAQDVLAAASVATATAGAGSIGGGAGSRAGTAEAVALGSAPAESPVRSRVAEQSPAATSGSTVPAERSTYGAPVPGTLVPLSPARKLIAQRMSESLATAPHAWTTVEADVTKLLAWRNREKDRFLRDKGYPLTLLPFFIAAVVKSLRAHPLVNSRFTEHGIVVERSVNVGIAIGLETNLVVPVIRDADSLSIAGLAVAAGKLIERARSGKLGAEELGGGTFTVNNTGANGSVLSKPIINAGQAAIVTMEAIVKRPVVVDDAIAIRQMMNLCLSLDHRVLDGTSASGFLRDLKGRLEAVTPNDAL